MPFAVKVDINLTERPLVISKVTRLNVVSFQLFVFNQIVLHPLLDTPLRTYYLIDIYIYIYLVCYLFAYFILVIRRLESMFQTLSFGDSCSITRVMENGRRRQKIFNKNLIQLFSDLFTTNRV